MSAYSERRSNQVLSFSPALHKADATADSTVPVEPSNPGFSNLADIEHELESFFSVARQVEAALAQERALGSRYRTELREYQQRHLKFSNEVEIQAKDELRRQEKLKSKILEQEQVEKKLNDQLQELNQVLESVREEKKKAEIEGEILRAKIEYLVQSEGAAKASLNACRGREKRYIERNQQVVNGFNKIRDELQRYKTAWAQISATNRDAQRKIQDSIETQQRVEQLNEALEIEKRRRESIEKQVEKEKREKQVALSCLHKAEMQLAHMNQEMEELRIRKIKSLDDCLELKL